MPAVEAEVARGVDKARRKQLGAVTDFVRTLRALEARRVAVMEALLAEEEAEGARRSKVPQASKASKAKASKAKKTGSAAAAAEHAQPEADQTAAAFGGMTVANAGAEAPPRGEAPPAVPPAAMPPASPAQTAVAAPPLPPWLTQVMQQPPPPGAAASQPAAPPRGAGAQSATRSAAAAPQRPPVAAPAAPPPRAAMQARKMLAGDTVPRELECAICFDAVATAKMPCCGKTELCAPCAAALKRECPLCRAPLAAGR